VEGIELPGGGYRAAWWKATKGIELPGGGCRMMEGQNCLLEGVSVLGGRGRTV
jgi:hypothetical protein